MEQYSQIRRPSTVVDGFRLSGCVTARRGAASRAFARAVNASTVRRRFNVALGASKEASIERRLELPFDAGASGSISREPWTMATCAYKEQCYQHPEYTPALIGTQALVVGQFEKADQYNLPNCQTV